MQEFFESFLRPASIEGQEDTARNARLLHLVLLSVFAFVILNFAGVFLIYKRKLAVSITMLALVALAGGCFLLMRCGRVRLASAILVFGLWCGAATYVALDGGLRGPSSFFFLLVCVFAALLLGSRGVITCAVLTILITTGMLIAESVGHPMPQYFFVLPLPTFIIFTVTLLFVLVPLNLLLSELKNALGLAQKQLKQREEADAALRESEDRYRDLVEHSEDLICTHDLKGNLLTVNDPPARLLGYDKSELLNRPLRDFVIPEARPMCDAYLSEIERKGFARGLLPVLTKSGEVRLWEYNNTLRCDGHSLPIIRGIAHDVTDQKRAEKALRFSEEKFSKAFRCSPSIVTISTLQEGRILEVNETFERQTGYARDEVIGQSALELEFWIDLRERETLVDAVRTQGYARNQEIHIRTKSGQVVVILLSVELIELDGEHCLLTVGQDITDRKRAEEELRRLSGQLLRLQDEERRKIARDLHDSTGQDLVALATTLSQLHDSIPSSAGKLSKLFSQCKALTDRCMREVRTLSYLLHPPLLDESGLEDALRYFADGFAERTGIEVSLEVSPQFGRLTRDMEMGLFRVVQESLINIQRHSGSLTAKIQLDQGPDQITLEVSDTGRGISASKRKRNGTIPLTVGVGIPSMEERVKQVGGRLEIESSSSGTIVRVAILTHEQSHQETSHSNR